MKKALLSILCSLVLASPLCAKNHSDYQALISQHKKSTTSEKIKAVNEFYNQFDYEPKSDNTEWKTPRELLYDKSGESVDFATAKFLALEKLGINSRHLKIVHGYIDGHSDPIMALLVYDNVTKLRYILDKFSDDIETRDQRSDLDILYLFDREVIWTSEGFAGESSMIKQWDDLLNRTSR